MSFPLKTSQWLPALIVVLISFVLWFFKTQVDSVLVFHADRISEGQWWRILTGHFLHTNFNHLLMNCAGLILLWALHGEHYRPIPYITIFLFCCLGTGIGVLLESDLTQYVGLSGALHGIFIWGALMDIEKGYQSGWLLLLGVWAKVIYEQMAGASDFVAGLIASNVAVDAHLYGTISGSIYVVYLLTKKTRASEDAL